MEDKSPHRPSGSRRTTSPKNTKDREVGVEKFFLCVLGRRIGLLWLAAGGLAYTGGIPFYLARQLRFCRFIWHRFVATGTACQFFAVLWYVQRYSNLSLVLETRDEYPFVT
jgi:hypothetical protein